MAPLPPGAPAGGGGSSSPAHVGPDGLYDGGGCRPVRQGAAGRARHGGLLAAGLHGAAAASAAVGLSGGGGGGPVAAAFLPAGDGVGSGRGTAGFSEDLFTMHADGLLTRHRLASPAAGGTAVGDGGASGGSSYGSTPDSVLAAHEADAAAELALEPVEQWALLRRRSWPEREAELPGVVRAVPYPDGADAEVRPRMAPGRRMRVMLPPPGSLSALMRDCMRPGSQSATGSRTNALSCAARRRDARLALPRRPRRPVRLPVRPAHSAAVYGGRHSGTMAAASARPSSGSAIMTGRQAAVFQSARHHWFSSRLTSGGERCERIPGASHLTLLLACGRHFASALCRNVHCSL